MMNLKSHREGWQERQAIEKQIEKDFLSRLSVQERLDLFHALCEAAFPFVEKANVIIDRRREKFLINLQSKLYRLADWQKEQNGQTL